LNLVRDGAQLWFSRRGGGGRFKWTYSDFCEFHLGRRHPVRPIIHASQIRQVINQRRRACWTREAHSAGRVTRLYKTIYFDPQVAARGPRA
jgi:hypothetical protein